ncbi:enoyl-CoA hydratase/isomerase family protein [Anaerobacillus sp. 1_MG-2023]|uniref:enoyl-CoA hydratase/isomerase family protein n=1 Tax=Anaerobacillus sp. 1_MG-2023 TaxID=3062655 RepID=UPI0026E35B46|nr:enoyl-CoA hydratase-related protein [Anaerobacillus sp. 1_MG-2023]MDO6656672.1 enoyl-CoA hydratase-related protein [Anaerobacillus sp. 1_MG-2023]
MFETIEYEVKDRVSWVRLNRPNKLNAFTSLMNKEIATAVNQATNDQEVRCIVITGNGRAFCSGQDLGSVEEGVDHAEMLRSTYNPMVKEITSSSKPVIAAVNGVAAGAGMSLALACDFRLAHERASFIEAFVHVGLVPDSGSTYFLPRLLGHAKALELAMLGEKVSAADAKELGLVTDMFSNEYWEQGINQFANRLASLPPKAVEHIKQNFQRSWESNLDEVLEMEAVTQGEAGKTNDHLEGIQAFTEKRKPIFHGS